MRIDTAITTFLEKYDREAIESIHDISTDFGRVNQLCTLKAFNMKESFEMFCEYLQGYARYKIKNRDNWKASPQDAICESVHKFINTELFKENTIRYPELPGFVQSYLDGVTKLIETVDQIKDEMMDSDVELEHVGAVNGFVDEFLTKLHESFDPTMDRFLWASGYNSRKRMFESMHGKKEEKKITEVPVFI